MQKSFILGNHPTVLENLKMAEALSQNAEPALIVGEFGTGRKTLCRVIHQTSSRRSAPYHVVDCQQEPQKVEDSILGFREESGKFIKGVLELSNGGTVVFENIDGLEEQFQKKLFRIMNELQDYDLDIRFLATTSKDLSKFVGAGRFQRSLYSYFSSNSMTLTPLREREGDIELLAKYYLRLYAQKHHAGVVEFTLEALEKVMAHYWSKNLKELQSVLENAVLNQEDGVIDGDSIKLGENKASLGNDIEEVGLRLMSLKEAEKLLIQKALVHTSENRTQAAKILGVSIRTLRNKINEYRGQGQSYFVNLR